MNDAAAQLASHKAEIITCLRRAYESGPQAQPFDAEAAWQRVSLVAGAMVRPDAMRARDRRDGALEIAKALGKARDLLERTIRRRPELARDIMLAWAEQHGGAERPFTAIAAAEHQIQETADAVADLEAAVRGVATSSGFSAGMLPPVWVIFLATVFQKATGIVPKTTYAGPFMEFISALCEALAIPLRKDGGIHAAVKRGLKGYGQALSRQSNQSTAHRASDR
jgi:hypothetical protein